MSIPVDCVCGNHLDLKDDLAGKQIRCPQCDRVLTVGSAAQGVVAVDPVFDRDKFLMKQQLMTVQERYDIVDEAGKPILFAERPRHHLRSIVSIFALLIVWGVVGGGLAVLSDVLVPTRATSNLAAILGIAAMAVGLVAGIVVAVVVSAKRHVTFYRDANKTERLLEILQDAKFQPVTMTFTVRDAGGTVLALLRKNIFTNFLRKKWHCLSPDGSRTIFIAKEDSVILSLLRRLLGSFFGLLRAQYIFTRGTTDSVFGEFNRKFTLLDRYVVDLTRDPQRQFDRRILLAMGIMLDSGERR